jgi:hypothetical protein
VSLFIQASKRPNLVSAPEQQAPFLTGRFLKVSPILCQTPANAGFRRTDQGQQWDNQSTDETTDCTLPGAGTALGDDGPTGRGKAATVAQFLRDKPAKAVQMKQTR